MRLSTRIRNVYPLCSHWRHRVNERLCRGRRFAREVRCSSTATLLFVIQRLIIRCGCVGKSIQHQIDAACSYLAVGASYEHRGHRGWLYGAALARSSGPPALGRVCVRRDILKVAILYVGIEGIW